MLSFVNRRIAALSVATSHCYEAPKPQEFGRAGENWGQIGWRVDRPEHLVASHIRPWRHGEERVACADRALGVVGCSVGVGIGAPEARWAVFGGFGVDRRRGLL